MLEKFVRTAFHLISLSSNDVQRPHCDLWMQTVRTDTLVAVVADTDTVSAVVAVADTDNDTVAAEVTVADDADVVYAADADVGGQKRSKSMNGKPRLPTTKGRLLLDIW